MFSSHQTLYQHKINVLRLSKNNEEENLDVQTRSVVPNQKHKMCHQHPDENINYYYTPYLVSKIFPQKNKQWNLIYCKTKKFLKVNWIQDINYNNFFMTKNSLVIRRLPGGHPGKDLGNYTSVLDFLSQTRCEALVRSLELP